MATQPRFAPGRLPAGWWAGLTVGLLGGLLLAGWPQAQAETAGKADRADRSEHTEMQAVQKSLKEVLENQQTIIQRLDSALEELRMVKVRCTR